MTPSVPPPGMPAAGPEPQPLPPRPSGASARRKLVLGAVAVIATAALGFVLFGGISSQVSDPIAQAATVSSASAGYRMHMALQLTSSALNAPITGEGSGIADLRDNVSSFSLAMNLGNDPQVSQALGGSTMRIDMIIDGAIMYAKFPASLAAQLPTGGKPWIKIDVAKIANLPGLSSLAGNPSASDPSQALRWLQRVSNSVQEQGSEVVDGTTTTHYQAQLSLQLLADAVPAAERSAIQKGLSVLEQAGRSSFPVDVWVDQQHLVRRIVLAIDLGVGGVSLQERMTFDLSNYGPQPRPADPSPGEVYTVS